MKLIITGKVGLLKVGDTHYTRTDEQGESLIEKGLAKLHPEADEELPELKRELYKDEEGNWRTRDNHGGDSGKVAEEPKTNLKTTKVKPPKNTNK